MAEVIYKQTGKDGYYRTWHKPEKNTFLFLHSGTGSIVTRDGSLPMSEGTLCFIGDEKYHYTFPEVTESYVRSKLFISGEDLAKLLGTLDDSDKIAESFGADKIRIGRLDKQGVKAAEELFSHLKELSPDSDYYKAEIYSAVLRLIALLGESSQAARHAPTGAIQSAIDYINGHITEEVTVEEIARSVYLSKYHFSRLFKERTGMTVMKYVLKTRITMAKELLRSESISIAHVSEECAFSSLSYFSRAFKLETGLTPLQYKKKNSKSLQK